MRDTAMTLLTVLQETLNEIAEEMKSVQSVIEKRQHEVQCAQEGVKIAEDQEQCAIYEDEQVMQKSEALRMYLRCLGEQPRTLLGKMTRLTHDQERTNRACRVAQERIAEARQNLQGAHTRLAVAEQNYADLQKQWGVVSEHIANVQRSV